MRRSESSTHVKHDRKKNRWWIAAALVLAVVVGLVAALAIIRKSRTESLAGRQRDSSRAGLRVEAARVEKSEAERHLLLIGEARPFYSVTLFARVSGYMDGLYADIGDKVRAGQLLAHVESPEQEQSYASARADAVNKRRIAHRMAILKKRSLVSVQQAEQTESDAEVAEANLRTQTVLRRYQRIVAPFDGVISNRFVDPGALLQNASGSQAASQPLFTITKAEPLRVFMYVDQKDAPFVHAGDPADILGPGLPLDGLHASVTRVAAELDPRTRTLLSELILNDPQKRVSAGSFITVRLTVKTPQLLRLPVQALMLKADKPYVGVIDKDERLHFTPIDLAENDGEYLLIRKGVELGQQVALNVGNNVGEGQKIQLPQGNRTLARAGGASGGSGERSEEKDDAGKVGQ